MPLVLITGASRGLGRALALGFSAAGWTVSACTTGPDAKDVGAEQRPQLLGFMKMLDVPKNLEQFVSRRYLDGRVFEWGVPEQLEATFLLPVRKKRVRPLFEGNPKYETARRCCGTRT